MRRNILATFGAAGAILTVLYMGIAPVGAQAPAGSGNALRISPVRSDLTIKPGETKTVDINITNVTEAPATFKALINDFGASDDETGQPRVYLDEKSQAPKHGLKKYVQPIADVTLQAQERRAVKATIVMPANAAGGGYYGVVRFVSATTSSKENVTLSGSAGTLLLVTVPGDIVEQASIKSFNVARFEKDSIENVGKASNFFTYGGKDSKGKGIQAVLRVGNNGNVQVAPFGKAILKKSGKQIASYELNNITPRANVLPDSTRRFTIDLGDKTSGFGKYSLEGNFGYGSKGQLISAKTSFYVVPLAYLLMAIGLILLIIAALLVGPRWLKSHDRKLLRKVRSGKR